MAILVLDVGGTHIKMHVQGQEEIRKCESGPTLTPSELVAKVSEMTAGWKYERITIGYPGVVIANTIQSEPVNLGAGWVGFDFLSALGHPVKILNDAAMQALGSYEGGRMLFLGLGTGLGTALVYDKYLLPMELGHLPYKKGRSFEEYVGQAGLKRLGRRKWTETVFDVVARLQNAFLPEYIMLGGGNVKKLHELPPNCRMGDNRNAFLGGYRLWEHSA